jgi:sulfonate transport system substrate-binding protein
MAARDPVYPVRRAKATILLPREGLLVDILNPEGTPLKPRRSVLILLLAGWVGLGACSGKAPLNTARIRVGYFPNITHSQAVLGMERGDFRRALGPGVAVDSTIFNAGPSVIEALFARRIDLAYIGPNPAINGYIQSRGKALRIVAGATSGGAAFVVRPESGIRSAADLSGKKLATPQLGNTQDVALRDYLKAHGLTSTDKGGTVEIFPTPNPEIFDLFVQGRIDGAWVPEPWASRLVVDGRGSVLVDERDLWPSGDFVTAQVIVATEFLEQHPDLVKKWLTAHVELTQWETSHSDEVAPLLNAALEKLTGKKLAPPVLDRAWKNLRPTWDPLPGSLHRSAEAAYAAGFLPERPQLDGIYALDLLNQVLREKGLPEVQ